MAKEIVEFKTKDGIPIHVEVNVDERTTGVAGKGGVIVDKTQKTFEDAISRIRPNAEAVIAGLGGIATAPDQTTVEFGVKLSAKAGMILASSEAEANLKVSLTWKKA